MHTVVVSVLVQVLQVVQYLYYSTNEWAYYCILL
jgi:hypothetical protein